MSKLKDKFKDATVTKQADLTKKHGGIVVDCHLKPKNPLINGFEHEQLIAKHLELEQTVRDLVMLVKRLAHNADAAIKHKAWAYLRKKGLQDSPLRTIGTQDVTIR